MLWRNRHLAQNIRNSDNDGVLGSISGDDFWPLKNLAIPLTALVLSALVPTLSMSLAVADAPTSITVTSYAPTLTVGKNLAVPLATLALASQTPALSTQLAVPASSLTLANQTPHLTANLAVGSTASLSLASQVPSLQVNLAVPTASFSLTGQVPTLRAQLAVPTASTLNLASQGPGLSFQLGVPTPGAIALVSYPPTMTGLGNANLNIPLATLTLTSYSPTLAKGLNVQGATGINLGALTPSLQSQLGIPASRLSVTGLQPSLGQSLAIPSGNLTVNSSAPALSQELRVKETSNLAVSGVNPALKIDLQVSSIGSMAFVSLVPSIDIVDLSKISEWYDNRYDVVEVGRREEALGSFRNWQSLDSQKRIYEALYNANGLESCVSYKLN